MTESSAQPAAPGTSTEPGGDGYWLDVEPHGLAASPARPGRVRRR
jgi:hypothetical protein